MRYQLALLFFLSACGSSASEAVGETELRPAGEVISERITDSSIPGELGVAYELDDGLVVQVDSITPQGSRHLVNVRIENPTNLDRGTPLMAIYCANSEEEGTIWSESTIGIGDDLPAGTFKAGRLELSRPSGRCDDPVFRIFGTRDEIFVDYDGTKVEYQLSL